MSVEGLNTSIAAWGAKIKQKRDLNGEGLGSFSGPSGSVFRLKSSKLSPSVTDTEFVRTMQFCTSDAEVEQAKSNVEDFAEVFNSWKRFSHLNNLPQPAVPSELTGWKMTGSDKIESTINSTSAIGFVSPDAYSSYEFVVDVSSTSGDDDSIGLIAAYVEIAGRQHTLSCWRNAGSGRLWNIGVDVGQGIANGQRMITNGNFGLTYPDGVIDNSRPNPPANAAYGSWATVPLGCRIRIGRSGDIITFQTSNFRKVNNDSLVYHADATYTLNLTSSPDLEKFRGEASIGYFCLSQPAATFTTSERPASKRDIVDVRDNNVWRWTGTTWSIVGTLATVTDFAFGSYYYSPINNKLFYVDYDRTLIALK